MCVCMYEFPVCKNQTSDHNIDVKTIVLAALDIFHESSKHVCKVVPVCGDGWSVFTRPSRTKKTFSVLLLFSPQCRRLWEQDVRNFGSQHHPFVWQNCTVPRWTLSPWRSKRSLWPRSMTDCWRNMPNFRYLLFHFLSLYQSTRLNDQISSFVCAFFVKMWRDGDSIGCAELHFKIQL